MQTFLPYPDFKRCAQVLDSKRLCKQIVESKQILDVLLTPREGKIGWRNHPAVKMWAGYELALIEYTTEIKMESLRRGYTSNISFPIPVKCIMPPWMGHKLLHLSQQANLVRKNAEFYGPKFPGVEHAEGYWWQVVCGPNSKKHTAEWEAKCS